jgi:membrane associated rhomboid family serine protease
VAIPPAPGQEEASQTVPTCYRHHGRETYVSCVRCGRPACPDCLRSAAVGQQCVDCIRAGHQGARRPQGMFGGQITSAARVTWGLMALNVLLYIVELAHSQLGYDWLMVGLGQINRGGPLVGVAVGQWYRLVTSAFLPPPGVGNLGFLDIAFNMWALFIVGPALERLLGVARYLTVYLVSGIGGSVMLYLISPLQPAAGASGAIFGLFGAWFVLSRRLQVDSRQIVLLIVLNLGLSFIVPRIAWQAHIGGLIAGCLLTAAFVYAPRANRTLLQVGATAAILAIMAGAVVLQNHHMQAQVVQARQQVAASWHRLPPVSTTWSPARRPR